MSEQNLWAMRVGDVMSRKTVMGTYIILRAPGGWVFTTESANPASVFVPYSEEGRTMSLEEAEALDRQVNPDRYGDAA